MTAPTNIRGYDPLWMTLALKLNDVDNLTLPYKDVKAAKTARIRFYGFRRAMLTHDPENPMMSNMFQAQVTITKSGDLHFEVNQFSNAMRAFLGGTEVLPAVDEPSASKESPLTTSAQDETIMNLLFKKKPEGTPEQ